MNSNLELLKLTEKELSSWIYNLEKNSNMSKLLQLMMYPLQDALNEVRKASKMLILSEAKGRWLDLYGKNTGVSRDGRDDDDYRALISVGAKLKNQNSTFETLTESLASAFGVDVQKVKILEKELSPQLSPREIWVEVQSRKNIDLRSLVEKAKSAGIIIGGAFTTDDDVLLFSKEKDLGYKHGFNAGKWGSIRPFVKNGFTLDDALHGFDKGRLTW